MRLHIDSRFCLIPLDFHEFIVCTNVHPSNVGYFNGHQSPHRACWPRCWWPRDILDRRVVHADETPVQMLQPGKGKTHRAYLWAYVWAHAAGAHENIKAVACDFCESRAGANAKAFLDKWRGSLVVDDFSGYKQLMGDAAGQITEVGCWAHARRKLRDLHLASQSQIAEQAIQQIAHIYAVERQFKGLGSQEHLRMRQEKSQPLVQTLNEWLMLNRQKVMA